MSRLEHYAGQDEIGLRYNSHRTKREEYLVMSLWKGSPGMWRIRGPYGEVLRFPESGDAPVTGRCCVRHNGDGEKDGDANHPERDVSAVTEG